MKILKTLGLVILFLVAVVGSGFIGTIIGYDIGYEVGYECGFGDCILPINTQIKDVISDSTPVEVMSVEKVQSISILNESSIVSWRYSGIPKDYYTYNGSRNIDLTLLEALIDDYKWKDEYEEGKWDCTEMSAYMEWFLESKGYHTIFGYDDGHMWILVDLEDGYITIETTGRYLVWDDDDEEISEYEYYDCYQAEDIYELMRQDFTLSEVDWWNKK